MEWSEGEGQDRTGQDRIYMKAARWREARRDGEQEARRGGKSKVKRKWKRKGEAPHPRSVSTLQGKMVRSCEYVSSEVIVHIMARPLRIPG